MTQRYFSHGRGALAWGLRSASFEAGSEILVPDYVCSIVPDVIEAAGLVPRYYMVDQLLRPSWETVRADIGPRTRALLIVHYFGVGQNIDECIGLCGEHALVLIEDNAHGFGAVRESKLLGTFGDIGISSPRKVLAVRNGGILYSNHVAAGEPEVYPPQPGQLRWKLRQELKKVIDGSPTICHLIRRKPNYLSENEGRETIGTDLVWSADAESIRQIEAVNLIALRQRRQACWRVWRDWSKKQGLCPVFQELHPGDSPLSFAVRVHDAQSRATWFDWGWKHLIDVHSWPALPQEVIKGKRSGFRHWTEIVCFPISAKMTPRQLGEQLGV